MRWTPDCELLPCFGCKTQGRICRRQYSVIINSRTDGSQKNCHFYKSTSCWCSRKSDEKSWLDITKFHGLALVRSPDSSGVLDERTGSNCSSGARWVASLTSALAKIEMALQPSKYSNWPRRRFRKRRLDIIADGQYGLRVSARLG